MYLIVKASVAFRNDAKEIFKNKKRHMTDYFLYFNSCK